MDEQFLKFEVLSNWFENVLLILLSFFIHTAVLACTLLFVLSGVTIEGKQCDPLRNLS